MSASPFFSSHTPSSLKSARWIWADNPNWDLYNCFALFRKEFTLRRPPASAKLSITADQSYQLYINGKYVCRGPARGFQSHWPYDDIDVSSFLQKGKNLIAIRAYHPGVSNFQYISQGFAGVLFALETTDVTILSDTSWKCRRQSGIARNTVPASLQLFPQEHIDARVEDPDWMKPEYSDAHWSTVRYSQVWNSMPWSSLEPRGIPMLEESVSLPATLLGKQSGQSAHGFADTRDVVALRAAEGWDFTAAEGAPTPLEVPPGSTETFTSYLIDFGRTTVGSVELTIQQAIGGEIIDTLHTESISPPLTPDVSVNAHSRLALGGRLICRPGRNEHRFYHPMGFRYLVITVRGACGRLSLEYCAHRIGYPFQTRGSFTSSDDALERIWSACEWTQRCCSLDAYVDTPWREQAQWWGDARVQGWNSFHMDGDTRLFRRGIHCIASQTSFDGVTYGHSPTVAHECVLPDFTLIWMLTLWDYYWQTGSTEPFESHLSTITNALDYFEKHTGEKTGLLAYDNRYWLFLDWCDIFKDGYPAIYNLWYLAALDKLTLLANLSGQSALEARTQGLASKLRAALLRLVDKKGLCRDGLTWKGDLVPIASVHAQTLAIMTGLIPEKTQSMIESRLLPLVRGEKLEAIPSAYWITFVFSVLIEHSYSAEVLEVIRNKWSAMADHSTTWEVFNPKRGEESFSHAWSAHPLFHLMQSIGGIRQTAPAWKKIDFAPVFHGTHGGAVVPSPLGNIESTWKREGSSICVQLRLPADVEARVYLPGMAPTSVTGTNSWSLSN